MSLCPEGRARAAMTDAEFWDHVADNLGAGCPPDDGYDPDDEPDELVDLPECPVCGERGECAYDIEGRPLIHATPEEDS